ncbi:TPA: hypothetical protein I7658_21735 [Vibrio vulnificus]|nr:hypothetical protein [Vibrio vulnificus]HAS8246045.1 hypothetical protein [Vibrio vulnificus]
MQLETYNPKQYHYFLAADPPMFPLARLTTKTALHWPNNKPTHRGHGKDNCHLKKLSPTNVGRWHISPAMNLNGDNTKETKMLKPIFGLLQHEALP